ncbi:MAG: hypothetical protein CO030_03790 [Candidatus Magasanikbacteria bacterium CG_4_9_14_0_2_um_filter_42_11]|uniref:Glycosyltransferase 2-like domain-containing protein n=1 Tax=Candidatus Magasanikbacteria bacterium CG_4_9_14_0_2_um_filter_42_11 TaxID=1974643 RepID=A0A2M8F8Y7_9BACT|nr:MAG: hypothetical protein COU34_05355 [Candidatus Magasanikbacteria bacterium CG10_big_fil_rev_8_21_14_0_10_43_9]PIY92655.1 MAG: hypothetical protein COY70_02060 [Candidatus Magasanikbacteria bacterium CG_4_10_14_0_8_um_filter_42_12]PJC52215.1 MAG: hypothetical protein CO030_03790 [Candidatus Magasanikbacteria bacterium CG_4_9_14_0_2_um_filter_42_11]
MISVVIPVYNRKEVLLRSLASLEIQTFHDFEVIIVDDGSSPAIRLQTTDYRFPIEFVRQENKGAPSARNKGFSLSKGEYVIFWDADLIAEPNMLEKMLEALDSHPEASFAYSNFTFGKKKMPGVAFDVKALQKRNYIVTSSLIRRKDVITWDESLKKFQDWDYFLTLSEQGKKGVWIEEYLFDIEVGGTMSEWLPRCAYHAPIKWLPGIAKRVKKYERAKKIIQQKHYLSDD